MRNNTLPLCLTVFTLAIPIVVGLAAWYAGPKCETLEIDRSCGPRLSDAERYEVWPQQVYEFVESLADVEPFVPPTGKFELVARKRMIGTLYAAGKFDELHTFLLDSLRRHPHNRSLWDSLGQLYQRHYPGEPLDDIE